MSDRSIKHFVDLAVQGKSCGASSGARAASALARAVVEHAPALDDLAIDGLIAFINAAKMVPETARNAIGE